MDLYAIEFELEDFGQNVSHVVRKTYYTYDFFTDRQVYSAITKDFDLIGRDRYEFKRVPCSLAIPLNVQKQKIWFSITNADLQKEQVTGALTYITEGYQEYLLPGSKFLAFSFIKPKEKTLFIGKKSSLAIINNSEKVDFEERKTEWTTLDIVYFNDYQSQMGKEILELKLLDASKRFLVGHFKTSALIEVAYNGKNYRFYSLWKNTGG